MIENSGRIIGHHLVRLFACHIGTEIFEQPLQGRGGLAVPPDIQHLRNILPQDDWCRFELSARDILLAVARYDIGDATLPAMQGVDRKSRRLDSSHYCATLIPSYAFKNKN